MTEATLTKEKEIQLATTEAFDTSLKINFVSADTIGLSFNGMPGNQPNTYGDFVAIWQNQDTIPWNQEPLNSYSIPTNTQSGSLSFEGLDVTNQSYIIGYSVGPTLSYGQKYGNVIASAYVPAGSDSMKQPQYQYHNTYLTLVYVGTNSVAFQFQGLTGWLASEDKSWAGLWRSSVPSYNNPPDTSIPITIDSEAGTASFNDVKIGRGLTYTIGFFASGWIGQGQNNDQKTLCASLTFTNK